MLGNVQILACSNNTKCNTPINGGALAETAAFATNTGVNGAGTWEMVATANSPNGDLEYGCTRDNYASWKTFDFATPGLGEGDTTAAYGSGDGLSYVLSFASSTGLRLFWTPEPCPANGNAAWTTRSWTFASGGNTLDHPALAYDPVYNKKYFVWTQTVNGLVDLQVTMLNPDLSVHSVWSDGAACSNFHGAAVVPSAAVDPAGNVHIVYLDNTPAGNGNESIVHEVFLHNGGGFSCVNNVVGPYRWPPAGCAGCPNWATWPNVGTPPCMRAQPAPSIAIDNFNPTNLVVTYSTMSTDTSCGAGTAETYVYHSNNLGGSWTSVLRSCPTEAVFPRVATGTMPGGPSAPGLFHIVSDIQGNAVQLAPFDIKSTDGGQTWQTGGNGGWLAGGFTPTPINAGNCYAGDYEGATPDLVHNRFFYAWGQPITGANWGIEGNTNDP